MEEEKICHLFYYGTHIQDIWNQVQVYFTDSLHFSQLTSQTVILTFHNNDNDFSYSKSQTTFTQTTHTEYHKIQAFVS